MHHLSIVCDCFPATSVELRTWDKDLMVHKILSYLISGPLWGKFADPLIKKKKNLATPHGMWYLPSPARDGLHSPWIGRWSPGRWTARELPDSSALKRSCVADARLPACFPAPHLSTCLLSAVFRPHLILSQFLDLYCPCSNHRMFTWAGSLLCLE